MKQFLLTILFTFLAFLVGNAQTVVIDGFETGVGHFVTHTTFAGQTAGILSTIPSVDSLNYAFGTKSLKVVLVDDPNSSSDWVVRLLSGTGSPGNNVQLDSTGYIGFWLKTNKTYLRTALTIDESAPAPAATEYSDTVNIIGDNQWHLYQWNLADSTHWFAWVGASNGTINKTPTLDAIWFWAPNSLASNDTANVYIDQISWNPSGQVPVELVSFSASTDKNVIDLKWITASELNNKGFEVQRRTENSNYQTIAFIQGKGTTTQVTGYTYSDVIDQAGVYYYRLKQVDFDGTFEYSNEVMVSVIALPGQYALAQNFPNPFNPATTIEFVIPQTALVHLSIFNLLGEKVADLVNEVKESGNHTVVFDASNLSSGTYIYTMSVNGNVFSKKLTLVK